MPFASAHDDYVSGSSADPVAELFTSAKPVPLVVTGERRTPKRCYVYAHLGPGRTPFYIGKGTGPRAWSTDRDAQWHHFVRTRCGGAYEVSILAEDLDDEEALDLEADLIAHHGRTLTNWVNPGRQFDYAALDRFHQLRDATTSFISATRPLETSDPEQAVARYRQAIAQMYEYCAITYETGLVADLRSEIDGPSHGDVAALDRLTLVLRKLGRFNEIVEAVDEYYSRFQFNFTQNHPVNKRRAEAIAILAGERKRPRPAGAKPRVAKTGSVPEQELAPLLVKARRDRAPGDWLVAARLCRSYHDVHREVALLEEFLGGKRVPGRSWLELEERLFKLRAVLADQG